MKNVIFHYTNILRLYERPEKWRRYVLTICMCTYKLTSTWPRLNSDVGLEEGEY